MTPIIVTYVTSSDFKKEENAVFSRVCTLLDGTPVSDLYAFDIREVSIRETLEVDITLMVTEEVKSAYARLKVPCIVEHAGLIFDLYRDSGYPGGLTKPMWNTLRDSFVTETHSSGKAATARAVVAYCDGQGVDTFTGETSGTISETPRGSRSFYWDTIFIPGDDNPDGYTYAEIVDKFGLEDKIRAKSQSTKAMLKFLEWRRTNDPELWQVTY
jgi:inosine/xanthosine triphosphate pyrophosphatase family protein